MPRRPLFCQTCTNLLDQLTKAADAAAAAGSDVLGTLGTEEFRAALQTKTELRNRYLEIKERVLQHRETAHRHSTKFDCRSK
jgi:hypothetical protein